MITKLKRRMIDVWPTTQLRLAQDSGINKARVSEYVTGITPIPPHHLIILADILWCKPSEIVGFCELAPIK